MKTMIEKFQNYLTEQDHSTLTIKSYRSDVVLFIRWYEQVNRGVFILPHVTPSDVRDYRAHMQKDLKLRASTVNRKLASLNSLFNWAVEYESISSNPAVRVKYVSKSISLPRWLDRHEQFALQRAIEKDLQLAQLRYPKRWLTRRRDASLVQFMLNTGLRLSETIFLLLEDIEISARKGQVLVRRGKGNKERIVPLNSGAREALQEWFKVRPQCDSHYLWLSLEGGDESEMNGRTVQRIFKRYGKNADIQGLTPHVMRHTFAKNLADRHIGVEIIANLLGHENLNTTQLYIKPNFKDLQKAMED